jgi:hypothetical protein
MYMYARIQRLRYTENSKFRTKQALFLSKKKKRRTNGIFISAANQMHFNAVNHARQYYCGFGQNPSGNNRGSRSQSIVLSRPFSCFLDQTLLYRNAMSTGFHFEVGETE